MRKALMAVLLICVISVAVAIPLLLSHGQIQIGDQNGNGDAKQTENHAANQTESGGVKIADFEWTSGWGPGAGGLQWGRAFNITLQNLGNSTVEGLSVDVKLLVNGNEILSSTGLYGPGIIGYTAEYPHGFDGKLNASETREMRGAFTSRLDILDDAHVWDQGGQKAFSVRVMMNGTIMDELLRPF
jgi:hypothetical protein